MELYSVFLYSVKIQEGNESSSKRNISKGIRPNDIDDIDVYQCKYRYISDRLKAGDV